MSPESAAPKTKTPGRLTRFKTAVLDKTRRLKTYLGKTYLGKKTQKFKSYLQERKHAVKRHFQIKKEESTRRQILKIPAKFKQSPLRYLKETRKRRHEPSRTEHEPSRTDIADFNVTDDNPEEIVTWFKTVIQPQVEQQSHNNFIGRIYDDATQLEDTFMSEVFKPFRDNLKNSKNPDPEILESSARLNLALKLDFKAFLVYYLYIINACENNGKSGKSPVTNKRWTTDAFCLKQTKYIGPQSCLTTDGRQTIRRMLRYIESDCFKSEANVLIKNLLTLLDHTQELYNAVRSICMMIINGIVRQNVDSEKSNNIRIYDNHDQAQPKKYAYYHRPTGLKECLFDETGAEMNFEKYRASLLKQEPVPQEQTKDFQCLFGGK